MSILSFSFSEVFLFAIVPYLDEKSSPEDVAILMRSLFTIMTVWQLCLFYLRQRFIVPINKMHIIFFGKRMAFDYTVSVCSTVVIKKLFINVI